MCTSYGQIVLTLLLSHTIRFHQRLCAIAIQEYDQLQILAEQIICNAKSIDDKLVIFQVNIRLFIIRSDLSTAISCSKDVLSSLGEEIPQAPTSEDITLSFLETRKMLDPLSDEDLINYKLIPESDRKKMFAMKFLAKLTESQVMSKNPQETPLAILKMVQISLKVGMSIVSPLAFVQYASFLATQGDIREGYRYARVAKALLDSNPSNIQVKGELIAYFGQLLAFVGKQKYIVD